MIYNSFYYIGEWKFDRQDGYGRQVDHQGNVQEGLWEHNNFLGAINELEDEVKKP
jgi:hypothetical protein